MTTGLTKLTAYFAERERAGDRFFADALLDLFATRQVSTSVMLRGIASFGPRNIVRTDQTLSLSEDPPVVVTAVDDASVIAELHPQVTTMMVRGVVSMETGHTADRQPPTAEQTQVTVYVGRQQRLGAHPAYRAIIDIFRGAGFVSGTAFLGVDGTVAGRRERARFLSRNVDVPMQIVGIGTAEQAADAADVLIQVLPDAPVVFERVRVCKRDGMVLERPQALAPGGFGKLTVLTAEDSRHDGVPIHRAVLRRLRESGVVSGATTLRGFWGFHGSEQPHGDRLWALSRHVPVATVILDTGPNLEHAFAVVDELTPRHGVVTSELVPSVTAVDRTHHQR